MNLSFSPTLCPELLLPDALKVCTEAGFNRMELFRTWTESSPVHRDTSVRIVRERLDAAGVTLTGLNIRNLTGRKADSDERDLRYNLRQVEWDLHLSRALRLQTASLKGGARTDEAQEDLMEGINTLLERIPEITLNLGNHKGNRLQGLADYQAILPHVPDPVKVLMDTGHLLSAGENVLAFAESLADRIGLVHLRDQKGENPVPFGEGDLPFADLLGILKGADYDGTLVIELEHVTWAEHVEAAHTARLFVEDLLAA
ncbi:MAG: sugar phosphate isomerase/epimerase [bacterium]|nr:sugar phosphate isomerase/epimerase [bacterium]